MQAMTMLAPHARGARGARGVFVVWSMIRRSSFVPAPSLYPVYSTQGGGRPAAAVAAAAEGKWSGGCACGSMLPVAPAGRDAGLTEARTRLSSQPASMHNVVTW